MNIKHLVPIFFLFLTVSAHGAIEPAQEYKTLIQTHKEYLQLEKEVFDNLVFALSERQFKKGQMLKLILEDQLGRKWMWKLEKKEMIGGARRIYVLFTLFGINTPEVHFKVLNVNGKELLGSLQRFIPARGTLDGVKPTELPQNCLEYLLKTHIFYWLLANLDANPSNFIVIGNNKIKEIIRVDNTVFGDYFSEETLQYDYHPPWWNQPSDIYYYRLWTDYISGKISLALRENYEFILFVSNSPDRFFKELFSPATAKEKFAALDLIIQRKHNLPEDFAVFYNDLTSRRGETFKASKKTNYRKISRNICGGLKSGISRLRKEQQKLQKNPELQQEIKAVLSQEAFLILYDLYYTYWQEPQKWKIGLCDEALRKLSALESESTNRYEKQAIKAYTEEVKRIKSTGKPSCCLEKLSGLVNVIPEGK